MLLTPAGGAPLKISEAEYRDKVYASWLGQCVGNLYGLAHEQKYFVEPGPDRFPLGYSGWGASRMKELNGAFSDDDTDVEYMYLLAMERYGAEPSYAQLAEFWRRHVRREVWLANRAAAAAMRYGLDPPWSGDKRYNPHWFQIDPQLVNEIWAVTAPGMVRYATAKSHWAGRIMSDDPALEPTVYYAAMYATAFFESDVGALIAAGKTALPAGARFAGTIDRMIALHEKYPRDWKAARRDAVPGLYYGEPEATRTATGAHLNAALGVLALLYGEGDFQRTLDLACALGFDADNQAATLAGLLGIAHGTKGIPRALLFPFPELNWTEPLNDRYINVTREDLPNAGLKDIAQRLAGQGEKVILGHGGRKRAGFYEVNADAAFEAPFEFPAGPLPELEVGKPATYDFLAVGAKSRPAWRLASGRLPEGLEFRDGHLSGMPHSSPAVYPVEIEVRSGSSSLRQKVPLIVRGENLAPKAARILAPLDRADLSLRKRLIIDTPPTFFSDSVEVIRDGKRTGPGATFLSIGAGSVPREDYYGYEWAQPQKLGLMAYTTGFIEDVTGWFNDLRVEYHTETGEWRPVSNLTSYPPFPAGKAPFDKAPFAEYLLFFDAVDARAIRIIGSVGAARSAIKDPPLFTSIAELGAYGPVPKENLR